MRAARQIFLGLGGGASVPTARDYAQDGIIALWDGIENAGWGIHDANATGLKNLVGNDLDISFSGNYSVGANSVTFSGGYGLADRYDFTGKSGATISILASYASTSALNANGWSYAGISRRISAYYERGNWYLALTAVPTGIADAISANTIYRHDFVWDSSGARILVYRDGLLVGERSCSGLLGYPANRFRMMAYGNTSDGNYTTYGGVVYNCMVYARSISAAESASNYAIDKARFNLP